MILIALIALKNCSIHHQKKDQLLSEADNEKRHSASVDRIIQRKSAPTMKAEIE